MRSGSEEWWERDTLVGLREEPGGERRRKAELGAEQQRKGRSLPAAMLVGRERSQADRK